MTLLKDFAAIKPIRIRFSNLEQNAQIQIQTITDLRDLHLTKEEKDVLTKWRVQWETDLKRICKAIEKERSHIEKEFEKQQQKELEKIAKKDAPKFLFVSLPGKKDREDAAQTAEFQQQEKLLQDRLITDLTHLEKKFESQIHEHLHLLHRKVDPYRIQVENRISKKMQYLKELKETPYLFRIIASNGEEATGDPNQEIQFEVWVREDKRTECYIEQNKTALLSSEKNQCGLWSETEFRQYLKARRTYLEQCAHQKGFAEGQKAGYKKGFEAGQRAGLAARIDEETDEAFDELWKSDES